MGLGREGRARRFPSSSRGGRRAPISLARGIEGSTGPSLRRGGERRPLPRGTDGASPSRAEGDGGHLSGTERMPSLWGRSGRRCDLPSAEGHTHPRGRSGGEVRRCPSSAKGTTRLSRGWGTVYLLFLTEPGELLSGSGGTAHVSRGWRHGAPPLGAEGWCASLAHGGTRRSPGRRGGASLEDGEMARDSRGRRDGALLGDRGTVCVSWARRDSSLSGTEGRRVSLEFGGMCFCL